MTLLHRYLGALYQKYYYESHLCQPKHQSSKFIAPYNMSKGRWPHVLSLKLSHIIIMITTTKLQGKHWSFLLFSQIWGNVAYIENINPLYCGSYSPIQRLSSMQLYSFGHLSQRWVFLVRVITKEHINSTGSYNHCRVLHGPSSKQETRKFCIDNEICLTLMNHKVEQIQKIAKIQMAKKEVLSSGRYVQQYHVAHKKRRLQR